MRSSCFLPWVKKCKIPPDYIAQVGVGGGAHGEDWAKRNIGLQGGREECSKEDGAS